MSFHCIFGRIKGFNFDEVKIKFTNYFLLMHHAFGVMSKTTLPSLDSKAISLLFSLKLLQVYILHLELIFYKV